MSRQSELAQLGRVFDTGPLSNRNLIINGAMQVAQRGTSVTGATSSGYSLIDRWSHNASGGTLDLSQQSFTVGQTDVPSQFTKFHRVTATTGNNNAGVRQRIENVQFVPEGQVTLSFYAKGTNPNGGSFEVEVLQNFGSGGSSTVIVAAETLTVTSSWQRFTYTLTVPSISGKTVGTSSYFQIYLRQPTSDTSTNTWTLDFTGVQLEVGDTATGFEHRSYGDELARCQRYYWYLGKAANKVLIGGYQGTASDDYSGFIPYPVEMRASPTFTKNGTWTVSNAAQPSCTFLDNRGATIYSSIPAAGSWYAHTNGADDYMEWDAEL